MIRLFVASKDVVASAVRCFDEIMARNMVAGKRGFFKHLAPVCSRDVVTLLDLRSVEMRESMRRHRQGSESIAKVAQ